MISSTPKLRNDLTFREQRTPKETVFILKDPVTGEFFRLREAERFIAEQCDGATTLEVIRQRAEEKFGVHLPPQTLAAFVKNLEQAGLLETENAPLQQRKRRTRGSVLYLRIKLFDPDPLLNRLVGKLRFCFTPYFLVFSAALILLAAGIFVTHWAEVGQSFDRAFRLSTIPLLLAVTIFINFVHEFAHGLTCKHFGGEVHEMGFMLIFFLPAFYCNVSDAWLFSEKSKRLWVGFAGPYFEIFFWSAATVLWLITDVDTSINYITFIVVVSSGLTTLFNFNPFLKLDGYYLLSDYLGIPNLAKKSFSYVSAWIRKPRGLDFRAAESLSQRERRIYLVYGLVATVLSLSLLTFVAVQTGGFLIEQQQPIAFLLFAGLLSTSLRGRLRMFRGQPDPSDPSDASDSPQIAGASRPSESKKRNRRAWRPRTKLVLLAAIILAILFFARMELRVAGPFHIRPIENADVRASAQGIIEQIYVEEGDAVKRGDVIARLSDHDLLADLRKTKAEIKQTRARFRMLEAGAKQSQASEAEISSLEVQRQHLEEELQRLKIVSPATGIVATPSRQLKAMRHQLVSKGGLIAKVYDLKTVIAEITIPEKEIADVQVGQNIVLKARAYPDEAFHGKVTSIATATQGDFDAGDRAPSREADGASKTLLVTTQINNVNLLLKAGMTGQAKIYCGQRRVFDLVTRRLARTIKVEFWSWW